MHTWTAALEWDLSSKFEYSKHVKPFKLRSFIQLSFPVSFYSVLSKFPCTRYLLPAEHNRGTSISGFAMTGVDGDSTSLHRANTCTTYISVKRKNNGILAPKSSVFKNHQSINYRSGPNEKFIEDAI